MQLILTGCEYTGKRTLARGIWEWWGELTGSEVQDPPATAFHDHFVVPNVIHAQGHESHRAQSEEDILKLNPGLLEHFQRYQIDYHFQPAFAEDADFWLIDFYYGEAVYAPHYYGYGRPGEYGDRRAAARHWDARVLESMPNLVLVLLTAEPEVIQQRMQESPHPAPKTFFQAEDATVLSERFQEEFDASLIRRRFMLDTTSTTPEETLQAFVKGMKQHVTNADRTRILTNRLVDLG